MLGIKIKKLNPTATIPTYAHFGDAGMDLKAVSITDFGKYIEYGTGLSFEMPANHVMLVFPRSSVSNMDLSLSNCVGVLDSGFRGELKMRYKKSGENIYSIGDKIGQILIMPFPSVEFNEVNELSESSRGDGGFGSTGK